MMYDETFFREIQESQSRLRQLQEQAASQPADLLTETIAEMQTFLEELHVAEEELRQQNEELLASRQAAEIQRQRYQDLFDFAPDAYLVTDTEGMILEANRAASNQLNIPLRFLIGKPLVAYIQESDRGTFRLCLRTLKTAPGIQNLTLGIAPRSPVTPFHTDLTVSRSAHGQDMLRWLLRDATTRQEAEEQRLQMARTLIARREAEAGREQLRNVLEQIPDGFCMISDQFEILLFNSQAEHLWEVTRAETIGWNFWRVFPQMKDTELAHQMQEAAQKRTYARFEMVSPLNGTWLEVSIAPTQIGLSLLFRDISERRRSIQELEESEQRFRTLVQATAQMVWQADAAGSVQTPQTAWQQFTGQTETQMQGRGWINALHPHDRDRVASDWEAVVQSGTEFQTEYRVRREDGTYRDIFCRGIPIRQPDGSVREWIGTSTDITEQKQNHRSLSEAYLREHRIAETLQRSLLETPAPNAFLGLDIETLYQPAQVEIKVGGDFYDVFPLPDGWVALAVGDVSGKGLEAAAQTAQVKYALRAYLSETLRPGSALGRLNDFLCNAPPTESSKDNALIAMALTMVHPASGEVWAASAGAEPAAIVRQDGSTEAMLTRGLLLGIYPGTNYDETMLTMNPGDVLMLLTDGLTEAHQDGDFLGYDGLISLAQQTRPRLPDETLHTWGSAIVAGARDFADGTLHDDACLLLARLLPEDEASGKAAS